MKTQNEIEECFKKVHEDYFIAPEIEILSIEEKKIEIKYKDWLIHKKELDTIEEILNPNYILIDTHSGYGKYIILIIGWD